MAARAGTQCDKSLWMAAIALSLLSAGSASAHGNAAALEAAKATITNEELHNHAAFLADDSLEGRAAGTRGGRAAARYIETQLKAAKLRPAGDRGTYLQAFNPNYQNLLGMVVGSDPKLYDEYIVVGAHYDHVGYGTWQNSNGPTGYIHNGADDNASGVASLLEVVDAFSRTNLQSRRSIIFAFWDGEEIDLLGSRHWVRQPTVPLAKVRIALNSDMVGRMRSGRLEISGTRTAAGLRRLFCSSRLPRGMWLDFPWEYEENSDHWPFYVAGVPSLLLHTGLHDDYHRPSDDIEKLNVNGMHETSAYLLEVVSRLADEEELPAFRQASRLERNYTRTERETPLPPLPPRLGVRWDWQVVEGKPCYAITAVTRGSGAEKAGLRPGDRIMSVDSREVKNDALLPAAVLRDESEVLLTIGRGAEELKDIHVPLAGQAVKLGLSWREDSAAPGAVFITRVVPYSPAARAGLRVLDRIYSVRGETFASQEALLERVTALMADEQTPIHFEVETAGRIHPIDVDLKLPTGPSADASL
jgi:hypothetical protein